MSRLWILCWLILALSTQIVHAQAPIEADFAQTELNAVFVIDETTETTKALYSISYRTHSAETFTWVFPLPPDTTDLEVLSPNFIATLEQATQPILGVPNYGVVCDMSTIEIAYDGAAVPQRAYARSEPSELEQVASLGKLRGILTNALTDQQYTTLEYYAEQGWQFAVASFAASPEGLEVAQEDDENLISRIYTSPIVSMTIPGREPVLPLAFYASRSITQFDDYSSGDAYTATVYVAAQTPYAPGNQPLLELEFGDLRGPNMINGIHYLTTSPLEYPGEFTTYYRRLQQGALRAAYSRSRLNPLRIPNS